jgi:hypothetical protein
LNQLTHNICIVVDEATREFWITVANCPTTTTMAVAGHDGEKRRKT